MQPMIVLPTGQMSEADMQRLRENGICVVEADDPAQLNFLDPIPAASSRSELEAAALKLSRRLLHTTGCWTGREICHLFTQLLTEGTPLDNKPTKQEQVAEAYQTLFDATKAEEIARLAVEEAREERAQVKADRLAKKQAKVERGT